MPMIELLGYKMSRNNPAISCLNARVEEIIVDSRRYPALPSILAFKDDPVVLDAVLPENTVLHVPFNTWLFTAN